MPVLKGARAWLETATTLKIPELNPETRERDNFASSYVVIRPGESFSLRYDHNPLPDFDVAWKLSIKSDDSDQVIEQWGGPPLEMRRSRGVVKIRAMRISEDGTRYREFAWSNDTSRADSLRGTITLSLHLCHFAEATTNVASSTNLGDGQDKTMLANSTDSNNSILALPTTRPSGSKLWTWYWRDEEPRATFQFKYATREALQAEGVIPKSPLSQSSSQLGEVLTIGRTPSMTHKPRMSMGAMFTSSPADLIRKKQSMSVIWRRRGLSTGSEESDSSTDFSNLDSIEDH